MLIQAPYNRQEIFINVQGERQAQSIMDAWYSKAGFVIVDRKGTTERDLVLIQREKQVKVEEKFRVGDYGDFLIEIMQCVITQNPGWFYTENPDYLAYIVCNNQFVPLSLYWIYFTEFKTWFFEYLKQNKKPIAVISPKGLGLSLNLAIPWWEIPEKICLKYLIETNHRKET